MGYNTAAARVWFAGLLSCIVGRGLDPAVDVRLMITFSGNVAAPAPCVIRFGFLSCHPPSFLTGQKGSEKPAANSEARGTAQGKSRGPSAPPRFTIRQHLLRRSGLQYIQYCCALAPCICYRLASGSAPQDRWLYPRSCGPLWKPRSSDGVARDGLRSSQGKGSLLQYRFFPAGTAHPGSRSETPPAFAGGPTCRMPGAYLANILFPVGS